MIDLKKEECEILEKGFKERTVRVLVSTSSLACGVNLPAHRVIIREAMEPDEIRTMPWKPLSRISYEQMAGRAGRMGLDSIGEVITICKDMQEARQLLTTLANVTGQSSYVLNINCVHSCSVL